VANGIFVGLSTVDVVYEVDEFPSANSKVAARSQDVFVGGPAANASITFAHLGGKSTLVTAAGRHPLASGIRGEIERFSIRLIDLNPHFDKAPVISSISVNRAGERNVVSANATRVGAPPAQTDEAILADTSVVLVDGHYMQACLVWARSARARGILVVLDAGSWKDGTEELITSVDTAICSADFMPPGCSTAADVFMYLKDRGVTNIAITRGAEPICFASDVTSGVVRVPQVQVLDSMGAGDIFHGAFCYYASNGLGFAEALTESATVATDSCRFRGTREWMKHSTSYRSLATQIHPDPAVEQQDRAKRGAIVMADAPSPKDLAPAQEDAQMDQVSKETLLWTRRAFFATALIGGASLLFMMPDFALRVEERNRRQSDAFEREDELRQLLTSYLYPSNPGDKLQARVPLVPAMQDPWGPPKREFSGSGNAVAAAYVSAFTTRKNEHIVQGVIDVQDNDAPVLIASHLVSEPAARYFGDPKSLRPIHEVHVRDGGDRTRGFKANIRWAIYTPEAAKVVRRRELFQGTPVIREEPVHSLADLGTC
jgi:sugar/nucleoside kinase (ribokinase family)